jgi:flagellar biosynthetic protein FliR
MQELISLFDQPTVLAFLLLLARVLSFMAFMPVFEHKTISPTIRVAFAFYVTVFLFPLIDYENSVINVDNFLLALVSEITLGLVASFLVQIVFAAVQIIGDLVEYATALSMATMFDPATGTQQGLISRLLYLIILVVYLETGMYEITIYMLAQSFGTISLGTFDLYSYDGVLYATQEINRMFAFAFAFAFPLFFIGFILDIYYGYGTKSMPAFSPFVVTFQLKFALIFIFMMFGMEIFVDSFTNYFVTKFER